MAKTKYTSKEIGDKVSPSMLVQAENSDPDEFQQYVYKDTGKLVPTGVNVGYERKRNGEYVFYMCSDILYSSD